jgi:general secretion pathway protein M
MKALAPIVNIVSTRMAPAKVWFYQREAREQLALKALAVALGLTLLLVGIWQPLSRYHQDAQARYVSSSRLLAWMEDNSEAIRGATTQRPRTTAASGDWVSQLSRSAASAGVSLRGFTPEGDNAVRIQLEGQPFAEVLVWLQQLDGQQGIEVANAEFSSTSASGLVNVRATLKRGP